MSENLKKEFAKQYSESPATRKLASTILNWFVQYEIEWGVDFTQQEYGPLQTAFNEVIGIRKQSAKVALTVIRRYAQWRRDNGHPVRDAVFSIDLDTVNQVRQHMVSSPGHLKMILDATFDDPHDGTIDCIYRVFLWMGFAGMDKLESLRVTDAEVDMKAMIIRHDGYEYPIYRESILEFMQACTLTEFVDIKVRNDTPVYRSIKRMPGNEIMRGKQNTRAKQPEEMLRSTFRPTLARKLAEAEERNENLAKPLNINFDISYDRVHMSGVFYRAFEKERMGIEEDFVEVAEQDLEKRIRQKLPENVTSAYRRKTRRAIIHDYIEDYSAWKKAFEVR